MVRPAVDCQSSGRPSPGPTNYAHTYKRIHPEPVSNWNNIFLAFEVESLCSLQRNVGLFWRYSIPRCIHLRCSDQSRDFAADLDADFEPAVNFFGVAGGVEFFARRPDLGFFGVEG